ncbi:MAG: thiamine phosphate synthase [Candidatus Aceula meridiana]|nr:thiamine phosphate synthase [Candidatus Aceula meridiana]
MKFIQDHSLYLVTGEEYNLSCSTIDVVRQAIAGGVDIVQMREKGKSYEELLDLGGKLSALCKESGVIFIVNDDPYLAQDVDADGVHLGQEDLKECSLEEARAVLGEEKIIGISTHSFEQFDEAQESDCDYVAFGPIFVTKTKDYHLGDSEVPAVVDAAQKPVIFIGGIDLGNVESLLNQGAKNIAVIRAIVQAEDICASTKLLKERISQYGE